VKRSKSQRDFFVRALLRAPHTVQRAEGRLRLLAAGAWLLGFASSAQAQGWPDILDPTTLPVLNLQMSAGDWNTIQGDGSFSVEDLGSASFDGNETTLWTTTPGPFSLEGHTWRESR
jgi:hypothetical protein